MNGGERRKEAAAAAEEEREEEGNEEFEVQDVRERLRSSMGSRFNLIERQFGLSRNAGGGGGSSTSKFSRQSLIDGFHYVSKGLVIHPDNRWYRAWSKFILLWAVYSSFFTPMEFGFFRGLPENLFILDIVGQIAFLLDIALQFFISYRDPQTYRMVYKRTPIALRVRRVTEFFHKMEKDIRINYLELYCTHTAACIFYYLATTLPASKEGYTWIGSLKMGDYSYAHFRDIDIWKRYTTSLYFAIITMATVGESSSSFNTHTTKESITT
ncbi:unnamed protein product [Linum tenue]|uniref:Ion transport domain-containing protein n=1 Tax=Linum tenue TaxID=586396 RepID=A0AAV0RCH9_9ROSI|nr:unnamed protein product [Linum tenue]